MNEEEQMEMVLARVGKEIGLLINTYCENQLWIRVYAIYGEFSDVVTPETAAEAANKAVELFRQRKTK